MTGGPTLLAFDFDGTLAPIRQDPRKVRMTRAAGALIREATRIEGIVVAVASGRDGDDLQSRIDTPGAWIIASHGLEIRAPGDVLVRDRPALDRPLDDVLQNDIDRSGLRLEHKKHAVALHWRGVASDRTSPIVNRFRAWATIADLDLIEGRCVLEARCRGGDKEEALRWLARVLGASRVIYAGDDLTDFGSLRFAAARGRALFMASDERVAPPNVTVVESFRELFRVIRQEVAI